MTISHKIVQEFETGNGIIAHPLSAKSEELMLAPLDDPEFLILCYRYGVFPWYDWNGSGVYFYPAKRYIIPVGEVKVPKSIKSTFNQKKLSITLDTCFKTVIDHCKSIKRNDQIGSWISDPFIESYTRLHEMGYAHSVEVWDQDGNLVGGLYGVSVGKVFTGESMFSLQSGASRFALINLDRILNRLGYTIIDCQLENSYLKTFGGSNISKTEFFNIMRRNIFEPSIVGNWGHLINYL
jgi:leucyl/phenylalanyl-tRNA---protein transferase